MADGCVCRGAPLLNVCPSGPAALVEFVAINGDKVRYSLMPMAQMAEIVPSHRWQMCSSGRAPLLPCAGPLALGEHVMETLRSSSLTRSLAGTPFLKVIELKPCAVSRLDALDVVSFC